MKRKKAVKRIPKSKKITTTKLMFLSIILLFIVFEALYIVKSQQSSVQSNSLQQSVAGASSQK
ncbi:MAG: hypothetical protein Q7T54_00855 [Candidatus Levybacteria bacterium]|nr:hypothetical protein [Candidatus Levybacteria bacterium]